MRLVLAGLVIALAACTAADPAGGGASPPSQPAASEIPVPSETGTEPTAPAPQGDLLTGILAADSIEGGCAYLRADDGTRYEVRYPSGWRVRATPLSLTDPQGEIVASGGETITVRGHQDRDARSICQIGPIFAATEVVSIER